MDQRTHFDLLENYLLGDTEFPVEVYIAQISKQIQLYEISNDQNENVAQKQKLEKILRMLEKYKTFAKDLLDKVRSMQGSSVPILTSRKESIPNDDLTQGECFHALRNAFETKFLPKLLPFIRKELLKSARRSVFRKSSQWKHCQKAEHLAMIFQQDVSNEYIMQLALRSMDRIEYEKELDTCVQIAAAVDENAM
jgi:hypothetical protein